MEERVFSLPFWKFKKLITLKRIGTVFFGLASYYRKKLLYSTEISVENFRQEMLALEILALIRHCRLSEALRIIEWSLWLAREINKDSSKIQKAVHFLKLKTKIGEKKVQKNRLGKTDKFMACRYGECKTAE